MEEATWIPKTELGRKVQSKEVTDIDKVLNSGQAILEPQIVEHLLDIETELLLIGQAKGKFGGGQRRVFRQTQKKTKEGNKPRFTTLAVIGDRNGHVGIGYGKTKETVLEREKALRKAKINVFSVARGSGSWELRSSEPHTIPFAVEGKCGSVIVKLMPAPKGTGLIIEKECAKVLELAGIKDIWSKTFGQTKNKINLINALEAALRNLVRTRIQPDHKSQLSYVIGSVKKDSSDKEFAEESSFSAKKVVNEEDVKASSKASKPKKSDKVSDAMKKNNKSDVKSGDKK